MKNAFCPALFCLALTAILLSCTISPPVREVPDITAGEGIEIASIPFPPPELVPDPDLLMPEKLPKPELPHYIMGEGIIQPDDLAAFLLIINPEAERDFVEYLALLYVEEAAKEGINHDVAFAQMCIETGFLRFGNLVTPDMNNFAGLGSTGLPREDGQPERGLYFPEPRIGVRAQIQHLKAYASEDPLNQELVNPRYRFVRRGSSPAIWGLAGTWAADPDYADKINVILERLYSFVYDS